MKYGIIADIHANYPALKVALEYMSMAKVDKIFCLGDIVGYGSQPFECIQLLRSLPNLVCIQGNHDRQVTGEKDPRMRKAATQVLQWTKDNILEEDAEFLRNLPEAAMVDKKIILTHGSLIERNDYILTPQEISANLQCMINDLPGIKICFLLAVVPYIGNESEVFR